MFARTALSRTSIIARRARRSDLYHFENTNGDHLPFSPKKRFFAAKFTLACTVASGLPFLACYWQLNKQDILG